VAAKRGVIPAVVSQHAEEAAFQWLLRDGAIGAANYSLSDLARLDGLVAAHLDGLLLAADAGWEICCHELDWAEPGELFAASVLAFQSDLAARIETVTAAAIAAPDAAAGLASALGWLPYGTARPHLAEILRSEQPELRRLGLAGAAHHRADPGILLAEFLRDFDLDVTPRALRLAGELGRRDLLADCQALLGSDDRETRFWAAWSTTLLGDRNAIDELMTQAGQDAPRAEYACTTAARAMASSRARQWQSELATGAGRQLRLAAMAAGACGDPQLIPWLIELMSDVDHARVAGE
jgi:uncharacterized protein (TIGR02270 family)